MEVKVLNFNIKKEELGYLRLLIDLDKLQHEKIIDKETKSITEAQDVKSN